MKALLLAAGLGSRLRPFTLRRPKPLIPVANAPVIEYNLRLLKAHGLKEVAINVHYLPGAIRSYLGDGSRFGMSIRYSHEEEILGTGGGIRRLKSFLGANTFLVVNSDILCDVDLTAAVERHRERGAVATMVLTGEASTERYGAVEYDVRGRIVQLAGRVQTPPETSGPVSSGVFTGIHIMEPRVFDYLPAQPTSHINTDAYPKMITGGEPIFADPQVRVWRDIGTPEELLKANLDLLAGKLVCSRYSPLMEEGIAQPDPAERIFVHRNVEIGAGAELIAPVLVAAGCRIGERASLGPAVVVGEGCVIGHDSSVSESVLLSGARVEGNATIRRAIVDDAESVSLA